MRSIPWPALVVAVLAGCCCGGGGSADPTVLTVVTRCPGMDPETLEWTVTQPVELAVVTVAEVERIESLSAEGLSAVDLTLAPGADRFVASQAVVASLGNVMLADSCGPPAIGLGAPDQRTRWRWR